MNIISIYPMTAGVEGYNCLSGTSVAAPMVTAVAAMVYAVNPELTPAQVRNILCATAKDIGADGFDVMTGYGVVQADQAVEAAIEAKRGIGVQIISFKEDSCTLALQDRILLQTLVLPAASLQPVVWSSSNPSVVSVDAKGRITGKQAGTAKVTASCGGKQDTIRVTVSAAGESDYSLKAKGISYNKIRLSWKKLPGVSGYAIYRAEKKDSGYKRIGTVSGNTTSYLDSKRVTGKKYYYRIRAFYKENGTTYCGYSSGVSAVTKLTTPIVKVKAGKKKITVYWKKTAGANGYVIYRSSKKNGSYKRIAVVKSGKNIKYTNKKLRSKKKYYYKVKAYRKISSGKKVFSAASKVVGIKAG